MVKSVTVKGVLGLVIWCFVVVVAQGQEYDDMYFTKKDRKKVKYELKTTSDDAKEVLTEVKEDEYLQEYSAKEVNPEYIAKYTAQSMENAEGQPENPNYGMADDTPATYYPEDEPEAYAESYKPKKTTASYTGAYQNNNYNSPFAFNSSFGFGYNTWGGMYSSYSMGFGNFYGGNPYWNPWMPGWMMLVYFPFGYGYGPGFGYGMPVYPAYGYNYYCPSYYPQGSYYADANYSQYSRRTVTKGPRYNSTTSTQSRTASSRYVGTTSGTRNYSRPETAAARTTSRDYSETQSEYFRRSQRQAPAQAYMRAPVSKESAGRAYRVTPSEERNFSNTRTYRTPANQPTIDNRLQPQRRPVTTQQNIPGTTRRYMSTEPSQNMFKTPFQTPSRVSPSSQPTRSNPFFNNSRTLQPNRSSSPSVSPSRAPRPSTPSPRPSSPGPRPSSSSGSRSRN